MCAAFKSAGASCPLKGKRASALAVGELDAVLARLVGFGTQKLLLSKRHLNCLLYTSPSPRD
eukprot:8353214-Alexandrium_andersonii.AAC.1